jgi:hypothetical protein
MQFEKIMNLVERCDCRYFAYYRARRTIYYSLSLIEPNNERFRLPVINGMEKCYSVPW